ncbi:MAG: hypothetical protein PW789_04860 [Edaphobacter sp.]|uniref:hypothetical protein n=1 Tax=Edaphobacter sp. TaxID=1934404 RepID=UPI0023A75FD8|nr:hypothetical protein [Edaphobacter sp.]MDE1175918.1 hypothetical protein [Edaphobacter sp.]
MRGSGWVVLRGTGRAAVLGACVASALPLAGQAIAHEQGPSPACPVAVMAKYVPSAALRLVQPGVPGEARKPLYVTFGMAMAPQKTVVSARLVVRGMTEQGGVMPAGVSAKSPWLERTMAVNVAKNAAGVQSGTVWLTGFGAVSDVRVDSITYASGEVWKPSADESCHARTSATTQVAR